MFIDQCDLDNPSLRHFPGDPLHCVWFMIKTNYYSGERRNTGSGKEQGSKQMFMTYGQ